MQIIEEFGTSPIYTTTISPTSTSNSASFSSSPPTNSFAKVQVQKAKSLIGNLKMNGEELRRRIQRRMTNLDNLQDIEPHSKTTEEDTTRSSLETLVHDPDYSSSSSEGEPEMVHSLDNHHTSLPSDFNLLIEPNPSSILNSSLGSLDLTEAFTPPPLHSKPGSQDSSNSNNSLTKITENRRRTPKRTTNVNHASFRHVSAKYARLKEGNARTGFRTWKKEKDIIVD